MTAAFPVGEKITDLSRRVAKYPSESRSPSAASSARTRRSSSGVGDAIARCERNSTNSAANSAIAPNSPSTRLTQPGARPWRVMSNVNAPPVTFSAA